jgi:hypothetical protein
VTSLDAIMDSIVLLAIIALIGLWVWQAIGSNKAS